MPRIVRRLKTSDRDDVMEISRLVWEGHDYLSSVADEWLRDPNSHFYGVEVEGRVVAVGNLHLMEDHRTGWMEGLRVHPEFRGRGFANDITRGLVGKAGQLGVQRLRYTTSTGNKASLKLARMAGFSRVLRMAVCWQRGLEPIPAVAESYPIRRRSPQRTCSLLKANPRLVPHGILVYDWKALDCNCRNLAEIGNSHTFCGALKSGRLDSLSFGHLRGQGQDGSWSFTVYAADPRGFLSQLSHNVAAALKQGVSSIAFIYETRFEKTLDEVNLGSEERRGTTLVLLEKRMR